MDKADKKTKSRSTSKAPNAIPGFLLKTYEILENPANSDIISWNKEGNAFIVKKINEFSDKVLGKYFKHSNFASFVRQLNMYDFHKTRQESNENEFRHDLFRRGQKGLLSEIKRKNADTGSGNVKEEVNSINENDTSFETNLRSQIEPLLLEMGRMKQRMGFFETTTQALAEQNNRLLDENRVLWTELVKSREKIEKKTDLITMILYSILTPTAVKLFKRMFNNNTPAVFGDEGQGSKNPLDQTALENTISLPNDKIFQVDYDKLKKVLANMFQYSGPGENPFTNDPLLEGNSFNTKSNLFKNYVNILTERENLNKGILSHPKKEILDQNDRKRFEITDHDHVFEKPTKIMSKTNTNNRNAKGNESFLKYNEEDDQMRDFLRKVQKKEPSSNNMFGTPRSDKDQNNFDALLPQKVKSENESSLMKKSDERVDIYGSPLISSSPYRNPEFHDSFDLQNPSPQDNFEFKLPLSPDLDPMHSDFASYNHFGPSPMISNNKEKSEDNQQDPFADGNDLLEPMTIFSRLSSKPPESDKFILNSPRISPLKIPAQTPMKIEKDDPFNQRQKSQKGLGNSQNDQRKLIEKPIQLFLKNGES